MLRELHISNLAVIADARIELAPGLNCFTGATGAGKSLVVGAIEVLLGLRSPAEMLRSGADEGRVSGSFEMRSAAMLRRIEAATDVPVLADGGELLLTRRLHASGRSSVSLNGHPITLGMLKQVAEHLVDVHGQHDQQYLLKPANQLDVLDEFGDLGEQRRRYAESYARLRDARQRLDDLTTGRTLREQQLELYRFQAGEIDAAEVDPAEFAELQARASVLKHLEKLTREVGATRAALYDVDGSVLERLKMMAGLLGELSLLDASLNAPAVAIRDATIQLEEVAFDLSRYLDKIDLDPAEGAEVEQRLNMLHRLVSKYAGGAGDVAAVVEYRKHIGQQIESLARATDDLSSLQSALEPLSAEVRQLGDALSRGRRAAAARLAPLVERQLAELGMEKARFAVAVETEPADVPAPGPSGFDRVEFVAQTNPGLGAQPLRKIASGGELSRIMLALKGILAEEDRVSVLVFDEIDANVGGRLGAVIGSKLRDLASRQQVLCITHLPQIACYADRHLTVRKEVADGMTVTMVRPMEGAHRIAELAEMIGGQRVTDTTRAQAEEMLETARGESADASPQPAKAKREAAPRSVKTAKAARPA